MTVTLSLSHIQFDALRLILLEHYRMANRPGSDLTLHWEDVLTGETTTLEEVLALVLRADPVAGRPPEAVNANAEA